MRRAVPLLAVLMVLPLGCGEDEEKEGKPAAKESEKGAGAASYRREGNALCRRVRAEIDRLPEPSTPEELPELFDKSIDIGEKYSRPFEELDPPANLRGLHDEAVKDGDEELAYLRGVSKKMRAASDPAAVFKSELPRINRLIKKGNNQSRRLGLKDCVEDVTPAAEQDPAQS